MDEKSTNVSRMNVSKVNSTTDENEFEDELDLLLSLDSKQTTKQLNQDVDKSEATNDLEHDTSKQIEDTVQGTTDTTAKPIEKKEEDLEDWLDSVLGWPKLIKITILLTIFVELTVHKKVSFDSLRNTCYLSVFHKTDPLKL